MKKLFALVLALVLVIGCMAGCGSTGTTLADVEKAGKIVMATSPDFPPFEFLEGKEVVGIEVEIMELVAKDLGVELSIEQMDFDSVLPGVVAGKYDVGVSGISVTEKRKKNVLFTDAYCLAAQAIVVLEGSEIAGKADLAGKKISVQTGTTAESYCLENDYTISGFAANNDAQMALVNGNVDAWVIDDLTAAEMVKAYNESNDKKLVILGEAMTTEPYAFAFQKGSDDLVEKINATLNKLVEDGTVKSIFDKYEAPYTSPADEK